MKVTEILFILLIFFSISSCEENIVQPTNQAYKGHWSFPEYTDSAVIYSRVSDLSLDNYGFSILDNGVFIEKKNSGWCGTPPISYTLYTGSWREISDSILFIQTEYWGGELELKYYLIRIENDTIEIRVEESVE